MSSIVPGNNVAPVSFPGIASGIDYNSIITKLTQAQSAPITQLNQQINGLVSANTELIKINGLLASVQNALGNLSDPSLYAAVTITSSNSAVLTATGTPKTFATPGLYTITAVSAATATSITDSATNDLGQPIGHRETDPLGGATGDTVPLAGSYAQVSPSNGSAGTGGRITVNGVSVTYDVTSQSLSAILGNIQSQVRAATGDSTFTAALQPGTDTVEFKSTAQPITIGAAGDSGNLQQVLKLDTAQINNTANSGDVVGTSGVGGVNRTGILGSATGNNGDFNEVVTSGTFSINGVQITVDASKDALVDVLNRINASAAGVNASLDVTTNAITLTNKTTGSQSIVLGSASDTSNFLRATGFVDTANHLLAGASATIGKQAEVDVQQPNGSVKKVYSASNAITSAIQGLTLNINGSLPVGQTVQLSVSQDTTPLAGALTSFANAYNAAITEINNASQPPVVVQAAAGTNRNSQAVGGGVLFGKVDLSDVKERLVSLVSNYIPANGSTYNSLSTIGLSLSSSFSQLTVDSNNKSSPVSSQQLQGTDGTLQVLDTGKLASALAANPQAVQSLLIDPSFGLLTGVGTYLTGVTGVPTQFQSGLLGTIPAVSLLQSFQDSDTDQISSLQQQITQIQDNVNSYADRLRSEFTSSEGQIAAYQSLQQQLSGFLKGNG